MTKAHKNQPVVIYERKILGWVLPLINRLKVILPNKENVFGFWFSWTSQIAPGVFQLIRRNTKKPSGSVLGTVIIHCICFTQNIKSTMDIGNLITVPLNMKTIQVNVPLNDQPFLGVTDWNHLRQLIIKVFVFSGNTRSPITFSSYQLHLPKLR